MKDIVKLAVDSYFDRAKLEEYSKKDASEAIREALIQANGGSERVDYYSFLKHPEMYQIISQALTQIIDEGIKNQFEGFADVVNMNWGDKPIFVIDDPSLFRVSVVADGNANIKRQRLDSTSLTVSTSMKGVKIYEEFSRFMAGRINWDQMVNRVGDSFLQKIRNDIYNAIANTYSTLDSTFAVTTDLDTPAGLSALDDVIDHVEASTGAKAVIYGTKKVIGKLLPSNATLASENMKNQLNQQGFVDWYKGTEVRMIPQAHVPGTYNFAIDNTMLLIVPQINGQKIVKLVNEGEAVIIPGQPLMNADLSMEYLMAKKYGVAAIQTFNYAIVKDS